jgi:hypothetical protein
MTHPRPGRPSAVAAAFALAMAVLLTGPAAAVAGAQPTPPATTPTTTPPSPPVIVPVPTSQPTNDDLTAIQNADPTIRCTTSPAGIGDELVPEGCWGRYPSSNYDIGCDEGAWNHLSRKVYCTFTDLAFQGGRTATAVAAWLAGWAYSFDAASLVTDPAVTMANSFQTRLVGPLDVGGLAWFAMMAWVAFTALRGRVAHAAGEFVTSVLLAGLAAMMLANPAAYLNATFDTMSRLSTATLAAGTGHPIPDTTTDSGAVVAPIQAQLHGAFVEDPYDVLNWGTTQMTAPCRDARDHIVASGPHGTADGPRLMMERAGCDELAEFNHDPSAQRLFGAVLALVAAAIMAVLIALVSLTVVVAQLSVAVAFIVLPGAAALAVLPGSGRSLAVRWVTLLLRAVLAMVGMSFLLAVMLMTIQALLAGSDSMPMFARFALVDVAVTVAILARKRIITAGHGLAAGFGATAAAVRPGASGSVPRRIAGPAAAPGVSGFALAAAARPSPPGAIRRGAQTYGRYKLHERAYGRRTGQTHTTQHTSINGEGHTTRTTNVAGPAPTTRRARTARARVEHTAAQAAAAR